MALLVTKLPGSRDLIGNGTGNDTDCLNGNAWIYLHLKQCIASPLEWASFAIGMASIATWMIVLMPQIIKNAKDIQSVASISWGLLVCWCLGDTTNFVGAVLTNQGLFQEALGIWFVLTDIVFMFQKIYYHAVVANRYKKAAAASLNGSIILCVLGTLALTSRCASLLSPDSSIPAARGRPGRTLLSVDQLGNSHIPFFSDKINIIGYAIGISSCVFYTSSRLFQIYKNYRYKNVSGLERATFILCVVGNLLYGTAIFVYSLDNEYLIEHAPWIYGSYGILCLDGIIIYQISAYKDEFTQILNRSVNIDASNDEEEPLLISCTEADQYGSRSK